MNRKILKLALALSFTLISLNNIYGQTLLHQITRGDIKFQLYDDGFKINSVSKGIVLLESYKLGADLPIGIASYPFSNVNYVNNLHLVVQDNLLFNQWYANTISSWTANNLLYQVDAIFQNTFYNEGFSFHMEILANDKIRIDIQKTNNLAQPWTFRTKLRLKLFPNEYFMGFGGRLEGVAFRGKKMLNWISEGQADTLPSPNPENQGNYRVPFYLSTRGYGLLLNENSCSSFDLGESNININEIAVWDQKLSFTVYTGANPAEIIQNYTDDAGRILRTPEPWVFGVWMLSKNRNIFQTETDRSNQIATLLRNDSIPCSAIWHHYWSEKINDILGVGKKWDLDVVRYPNYSTLVSNHHADGFKVLHYYWPYIFNNDFDYNSGNINGYFMKNTSNQTYLNQWLSFFAQVAEPDLTRQTVRNWYKNNLLINAYNLGSSGGMIDFGEHHRIEMIDSANANPYSVHNEYPLWWAKTNQEFWEQHQPDGDYTYWMRGGWTGIQKYSPLMWIGDPQFDWSADDGIKTIIPAILSAGISGHPIVSCHIAGYEYNTLPTNSEELWIRWLQTCTMFPVMWTHEGNELFFGTKLVFDQSPQTLSMFKKYSKLHVQFFPYMYTLVKEGKEKGIPVARPLYFHYPNDVNTIQIKDQFLLGDRVMVAPVLNSGATNRTVYFPAGNWYDFWTGALAASGPTTISVNAPLDHLPIFVKEGAILPLYNQPHIETLVKNVPGINDFEYADSTMEFRFYGCGTDQFELWDSTVIQMHRYTGDSLTTITGGHPRLYSSTFIYDNSVNCFVGVSEQSQEASIMVYPNPTTGITTVEIEISLNTESTIEIYNLSGSLVQSEKLFLTSGDTKKQIDISNLTNGIYILKVSGNNQFKTIKVIKH
jgi:alpha-glucosidase